VRLTLLLATWWLPLPAMAQAEPARAALARLCADAEALRVRTGMRVELQASGDSVFAHRDRESFVPASNMKLFTAVLVLDRLGPDFEFQTRYWLHEADGKRWLRVQAAGDPCLSAERLGSTGYFADLTRALQQLEVRRLDGLYLDLAGWTGPARPAEWPRGQLGQPYAAPTAPLVLEEACLTVHLLPATDHCTVSIEPADFQVPLVGRVAVVAAGRRKSVPLVWLGADGLHLGGALRRGSGETAVRLSVEDPVAVFESVLRAQVTAGGIEVGPRLDAAPAGEGREASLQASPLAWSLRRMLGDSSNFHAEQLLRVVAARAGREASLAAGNAELQACFRDLAASEREWQVADGSGLSRGNRVSPRLVCGALGRALAAPWAARFVEFLPQSGKSGTLADRLPNLAGSVRAKTGWIAGASSLSGLVRTRREQLVRFSILMNYDQNRGGMNPRLKQIQDRMVAALFENL
jgi:D-alanyl-D-alanine carboxypeptidase/D-alanyl-D-alanine-endopeptidase (penicillin-binding protein 4)